MLVPSFERNDLPGNVRPLQDAVARVLNALPRGFLGGHEVDVTFAAGVTLLVPHKLGAQGRRCRWIVVDADTQTMISRDTSSTANRDLFLPLVSSLSCVVTLWVYPPV